MQEEIEKLAKELLIERIKSHMMQNNSIPLGGNTAAQWYADCRVLAEAILKKIATYHKD